MRRRAARRTAVAASTVKPRSTSRSANDTRVAEMPGNSWMTMTPGPGPESGFRLQTCRVSSTPSNPASVTSRTSPVRQCIHARHRRRLALPRAWCDTAPGITSQVWTARWRALRRGCRDSGGTPRRDVRRACGSSRGGTFRPPTRRGCRRAHPHLPRRRRGRAPGRAVPDPGRLACDGDGGCRAATTSSAAPSRGRPSSTDRSTPPTRARSSGSSRAAARAADRARSRPATRRSTSRPTSRAPRACSPASSPTPR